MMVNKRLSREKGTTVNCVFLFFIPGMYFFNANDLVLWLCFLSSDASNDNLGLIPQAKWSVWNKLNQVLRNLFNNFPIPS